MFHANEVSLLIWNQRGGTRDNKSLRGWKLSHFEMAFQRVVRTISRFTSLPHKPFFSAYFARLASAVWSRPGRGNNRIHKVNNLRENDAQKVAELTSQSWSEEEHSVLGHFCLVF